MTTRQAQGRAMIDADVLARARDADLLSTVETLGARLKRVTAAEWAGPCPLCGGTDRFAVNRRQQVWHCRGCAKGGGDAISLVMHVRRLDFREAKRKQGNSRVSNFPAGHRRRPAPVGWKCRRKPLK
jgi:phage/plasmid primase-like uncharacterized protein